jgi:putative hydrolase of the HAD superfamily
MTVDAVCFDLDDTLYDYTEYARTGLAAAADRLEALTGRSLHDEFRDAYFDEGVTEGTFDYVLDRHGVEPAEVRNVTGEPDRALDADDLVAELVEAYHGATEPLAPYPETRAVLSALDEFAPGLVTDGRGGHDKLDRLGLAGYFDAVLVTPTIDARKDERHVFERVLDALSVDPGAAVYVGDDPRWDFRVPNALGMSTVRVRRGRYTALEPETDDARPDHEVDSLRELPALLGLDGPVEPPADCPVRDTRRAPEYGE